MASKEQPAAKDASDSDDDEQADDDEDDVVTPPQALSQASGTRVSGRGDLLCRSRSAPSGEFLQNSRRRGIDVVMDEPSECQKSLRVSLVSNSDNGMQLLPEVGKPGSLMDPRHFCDVAEWRETTEWKLVKAQQLSSDMAVLAKVYKRSNLIPSKEVQVFCQERILAKLSGVNGVIRYYRTLSDSRHICLIFNQDLRPSLKTFIAVHGGTLREHFVVQKIAAPLAVLIAEVHRQGIIHRNLSPEHLLFSEDRPVVLTDFDNAVDTHPVKSTDDEFQPGLPNFRVGSLEYMAPEVVSKPTPQEIFHEVVFKGMAEEELPMYDTKADIFSLGVMLFTIMIGHPPWPASTPSELQAAHRKSCVPKMIEEACKSLSVECRDFLSQCLCIDATHRASAIALLKHTWISPFVEQAVLDFERHKPPREIKSGTASVEIVRKSLSMNENDISSALYY
jgi:serine/threonine protein kinase